MSGLSLNLIIVLRENRKLHKVFHYPKHWKTSAVKSFWKSWKRVREAHRKRDKVGRSNSACRLTHSRLLISIFELHNLGKSYATCISHVRIPFYCMESWKWRTWGRLSMNLWTTHGHAFSSWHCGSRSHVVTAPKIFFDHCLIQYDCVSSCHTKNTQ